MDHRASKAGYLEKCQRQVASLDASQCRSRVKAGKDVHKMIQKPCQNEPNYGLTPFPQTLRDFP
jgi:hypothetical protein